MIRASGGKAETLGGWGLQGSTGVTLTISNQATVSELWQQKHKKVKQKDFMPPRTSAGSEKATQDMGPKYWHIISGKALVSR